MAKLTHVVLILPLGEDSVETRGGEDTHPAVDAINTWLLKHDQPPLQQVQQHAGGSKCFCYPTYMGCFNHLDDDGFVAQCKAIPWRYPAETILLVGTEEDDGLRRVPLAGAAAGG